MDFNPVIYEALLFLAFVSLAVCALIYGTLTPWWRSRTGIGFMSTKIAFSLILFLTFLSYNGTHLPTWLVYGSMALVVVTVNFGVSWNIIYQQFIKGRSDQMSDKRTNASAGRHEHGGK